MATQSFSLEMFLSREAFFLIVIFLEIAAFVKGLEFMIDESHAVSLTILYVLIVGFTFLCYHWSLPKKEGKN